MARQCVHGESGYCHDCKVAKLESLLRGWLKLDDARVRDIPGVRAELAGLRRRTQRALGLKSTVRGR